jgi:Host cell surface-exposed lipoprotein
MNKTHLTALATTVLLGTCGVAAGAAQATTNIGLEAHGPGIGVRLEPGLPLSPASQENAVRKAQEYLRQDNFSHKGLVEQLEYDQFSADDAEYAVSSIPVDWNAQAAAKAKSYVKQDAFSHEGLVEQLEYDGFTASQAEYGVDAVGL